MATLMAEDSTLRVRTVPPPAKSSSAPRRAAPRIVVDRLTREFGIEAFVGRPQIAYKETLTRAADGAMKYGGRVDGRGHYGHVKIHLSPGKPGTGCLFESRVLEGTIPQEFIEPIYDGINDALTRGVLAGYPIDDVRIELYDGSYHDIDSSALAFRTAAARAFEDAAKKAGAVLLEPVMRVEVVVPEEYAGDVVGNLSSRRGLMQSREDRDGTQVVTARVPLPELFGYATDLRSRTMGRGTYSMRFDRYQPCPPSEDDEQGHASLVREPRRPGPLRESGIALPEPDDDEWSTGGPD